MASKEFWEETFNAVKSLLGEKFSNYCEEIVMINKISGYVEAHSMTTAIEKVMKEVNFGEHIVTKLTINLIDRRDFQSSDYDYEVEID